MFLSRISNEKFISLPFLASRAVVANLAGLTDHQWATTVLEDAHVLAHGSLPSSKAAMARDVFLTSHHSGTDFFASLFHS